MPTVLRVEGFTFRVIPGDHDPPHVHARYGGKSVVVEIVSEQTRKVRGMSEPDIRRAKQIVRLHRDELLDAWDEWHSAEGAVTWSSQTPK
jgi:hypothetical protein